MRNLRTAAFEALEGESASASSRLIRIFLMGLIAANAAAFVLETVETLGTQWASFFEVFEALSLAVFSAEYATRIWCSVERAGSQGGWRGRVSWALTPLAIVDLVAILPVLVYSGLGLDLRVLRSIRLIRIFRLLKIARYSRAIASLGRALSRTAPELAVALTGLFVLLLLASSMLYFAEREAQPDAFGNVPLAAWWGIATLTTVGYGDVYPITPIGKLIASAVAVLGVGLFAVPSGLLASAFLSEASGGKPCPHCGREIEE